MNFDWCPGCHLANYDGGEICWKCSQESFNAVRLALGADVEHIAEDAAMLWPLVVRRGLARGQR